MRKPRAGRWACVVAAAVALCAATVPSASASSAPGRDDSYSSFIVNGAKTNLSKWPYIVGVLQKDEPATFFAQFCGGSLVSPTLVLTAQHCTWDDSDPVQASDIDVLVKADRLSDDAGSHQGQRIDVTAIIRRPGYNAQNIRDDMALLRLASPVAGATPVTIVPPTSDYRWAGSKTARVAGFGCTLFGAQPSDCGMSNFPVRLREAPLTMMSDRACENLGGVYSATFDRGTMVCATGTNASGDGFFNGTAKSPCYGDSGGPLIVEGPSGTDLQVGVVSWGPSGCGFGPGVFARLGTTDARKWLRTNGVPVARAPFNAGPALSIAGNFTPLSGDYNGDGRADVLWYAPGSAKDYLWLGGPNGFGRGPRISVGGAFKPVSGDFDGDGHTDVFWYSPGAGADFLWRWNGTTLANGPAVRANGTSLPVVGDYDGDGKDDIFWYGAGNAADALWRGATTGFVRVAPVPSNGLYRPAVGDFDGDGKDDILWYGVGDLPDQLWRGSATGFDPGPAVTIGGSYRPLTGDFDGDGKDDILWFAARGADVLRYGTAGGFTAAPEVVLDGSYVGVPGDVDGDGRHDIVWYGAGSLADLHWRGAPR